VLKQSNLYMVCLSNALHGTHTWSLEFMKCPSLNYLFSSLPSIVLDCCFYVIFDGLVVCGTVLILLRIYAVSVFPCGCCGILLLSS
jgi:membrane-bound ClpP family serine protease